SDPLEKCHTLCVLIFQADPRVRPSSTLANNSSGALHGSSVRPHARPCAAVRRGVRRAVLAPSPNRMRGLLFGERAAIHWTMCCSIGLPASAVLRQRGPRARGPHAYFSEKLRIDLQGGPGNRAECLRERPVAAVECGRIRLALLPSATAEHQ